MHQVWCIFFIEVKMSIEKLVKLQGIDTNLRDLNDLLGDLPSKVDDLNQQEENTKNTLVSNKDRLKEIEVELNKRDVQIAEINIKVNKYKDQLFLVTNNKQYDALMLEIDHIKEQRSNFEKEAVDFLEEKETLTESVDLMESELGDLSQDLSARRTKLEVAISESADEKQSLEQKRAQEVTGIDINIVSVYDRVMGARDGLAVVSLSDNACGGCGARIPAQTVTEVRAKTTIHRCDACGRFIYNQEKSID